MTENSGNHRLATYVLVALAAGLLARTAWPAGGDALKAASASSVTVTCAPEQQAIVQEVPTAAGVQTAVRCVDTGFAPVAIAGGAVPAGYLRPAVLTSGPTEVVRAPATAPRPVTRAQARKPSWQKTALVIGGSAGAGAGIGALAGGKKGALIGAAIGGGAGTLYEVIKR